MTYSDATLLRYLAGDLPDSEASAVEAAVEADASLEARLMALDPVAPVVSAAFSSVGPSAILQQPPVANVRGWRGSMVAACAGLALAVGLGGGWWFAQQGGDADKSWVVAVAEYQVLYQPATVEVLDPAPGEVAAQLERAGAAVGADLNIFAEAELGGARLLRAQLLGLGDRPIVQMVYQLPDGTPLALCLTKKADGAMEQLGVEVSGLIASRWQTSGHDFLLIGATSENEIAALTGVARQLSDQI